MPSMRLRISAAKSAVAAAAVLALVDPPSLSSLSLALSSSLSLSSFGRRRSSSSSSSGRFIIVVEALAVPPPFAGKVAASSKPHPSSSSSSSSYTSTLSCFAYASRPSRIPLLWASDQDDASTATTDDAADDDATAAAAATMGTAATSSTTATSSRAKSSQISEARQEADDALTLVGWSSPLRDDDKFTSDDPFVRSIDESIRVDVGVGLDDLLNPAKVVNLERDLFNLRSELAYLTGGRSGAGTDSNTEQWQSLTTDECDGGGGGEEADALRKIIAKKERDLLVERRAVFRGWLKNVFLVQAILSFGLSWIMVSNPALLFGRYDWFNTLNLDISIRVLGFWWWWLFIVPSLRSRRPKNAEKKALDIAFLGTPLVSLILPALTKDTEVIWFANLFVCVSAYAFAFFVDNNNGGGDDDDDDDGVENRPEWIKFVYKSLDFGTGRERGARK